MMTKVEFIDVSVDLLWRDPHKILRSEHPPMPQLILHRVLILHQKQFWYERFILRFGVVVEALMFNLLNLTKMEKKLFNVKNLRVFNDANEAQVIRLYLDGTYQAFAKGADGVTFDVADYDSVTFYRSQLINAIEEFDANIGFALRNRIAEANADDSVFNKNSAVQRILSDALVGGSIVLSFELMKAGTVVSRTVDGEKVETPLERDEVFRGILGVALAENGAVMVACDNKLHKMQLLGVKVNPIEMLDALEKIDEQVRKAYAKKNEAALAELTTLCADSKPNFGDKK